MVVPIETAPAHFVRQSSSNLHFQEPACVHQKVSARQSVPLLFFMSPMFPVVDPEIRHPKLNSWQGCVQDSYNMFTNRCL